MFGFLVKAAAALGVAAMLAPAQVPMIGRMGSTPHIVGTDMAVLEGGENRKDLACTVVPVKPVLGFDLRFHAGYDVAVPLKDLAGSENMLTMLFRVIPENRKDEPIYFSQRIRVPAVDDDAHGDAFLTGAFDLGEGNYHVDWLMRDRAERVCSFSWDSEAALAAKEKQVAVAVPPGSVLRADSEQFTEEPPVERLATEPLLSVKVLVNFAPQNEHAAAFRPADTSALVSILRQISRDSHIGKFSLVAFNMQEQRLIYRQESANRIDFPALGEALRSVNLGIVDVKRLSQKHGDTEFLTNLIKTELATAERPDALVFAGPKVMLETNIDQGSLREVGDVSYPVFYMNYNLNPQAAPWRDSIGRAVKFFKGTEYTITRPKDLWSAVNEMVARIVQFKHGQQGSAQASQ